ncbi:MAG: alpha/beta hydrolase [Kiritimatiellia bacterium]
MKKTLSLCGIACAALAWAGVREPVWPAGRMPHAQPRQIAAMTDEAQAPGFRPDEHRVAYLEWFDPPNRPNGGCLILISGGGYGSCCDVGLIRLWREKFTAEGFQCVNFVYRTPRPENLPIYQSAWEDAQRAVRLVRAQAQARGYDPERIGTMSMSAGSHLATLLATSSQTPAYAPVDALDRTPCHVNWAITGAIAYGLSDGAGIPNTRDGDAVDVWLDPAFKFDAKTAPMCMFHGGNDIYSPFASTRVYRRLRQLNVPAELHLYADRSHGFWGRDGKGEKAAGYDNWFACAKGFLRQLNFDGRLGPEVGHLGRVSADFTARVERRALWPAGRMPDVSTNQTDAPYLEWHLPKTVRTRAIQIIVPGGAYNFCNVPGEGTPVAREFNRRGMAAVVVRYRTPRPLNGLAKHTTAWADAQRAIRLVRREAPAKGLDPDRIGLMGFSAGGHLTLLTATSTRHRAYWPVDETDTLSCRLQWAFPVYPAYVLTDGADGANRRGGNADDDVLVPEFAFDLDTPPMCFMHGDADGYAAMGSVKVWEKLRRMGIQSDLHTLARRGHCFQFSASEGTLSHDWVDHLWEFLNHKRLLDDLK